MAKKRFVVEGTWSGYRSAQRKVVHCAVQSYAPKVATIQYTDGTTLDIKVRPALKYERVKERNSYGDLIRQADRTGKSYVTVEELIEKKEANHV